MKLWKSLILPPPPHVVFSLTCPTVTYQLASLKTNLYLLNPALGEARSLRARWTDHGVFWGLGPPSSPPLDRHKLIYNELSMIREHIDVRRLVDWLSTISGAPGLVFFLFFIKFSICSIFISVQLLLYRRSFMTIFTMFPIIPHHLSVRTTCPTPRLPESRKKIKVAVVAGEDIPALTCSPAIPLDSIIHDRLDKHEVGLTVNLPHV